MTRIITFFALSIICVMAFMPGPKNVNPKIENDPSNDIRGLEDHLALRLGADAGAGLNAYAHILQGMSPAYFTANKFSTSLNDNWSLEGPVNIGGRFNVITYDYADTNTLYAGACQGGVFKTRNNGKSWHPVFDNQPFLSIGAITIDPQNHKTVYVGTGDVNISAYVYTGNGIYRSRDSGHTWTNLGLGNQRVISKIIVDPKDSNTIYAATMGNPFTRDTMRGLYKTTDGGKSWKQILFLAKDAGVIELHIHPTDNKTLYAVGFNRIRSTNLTQIAGKNGRVYKSTDAGATWDTLKTGLPKKGLGRPSFAIAKSSPNVVYLLNTDSSGNIDGMYKSLNGGSSFVHCKDSFVNFSPLNGQGWYSGGIRVSPFNFKELFCCGVDLYKTIDSAKYWALGAPEWYTYAVHGDMHDVVYISANHILLCTDGGVYSTLDGGKTWSKIDVTPCSQFYHIAVNPFVKGDYAGGLQDNGTTDGNKKNVTAWKRLYGGDGFKITYVPGDSTLVEYETQNGDITLYDNSALTYTRIVYSTSYPKQPRNWDMDYFIDAKDNYTLYYGTNKIHKTDIYGYADDTISRILTDSTYSDGGRFHTISTLAQSIVNQNYLFAGTTDGHVWQSRNHGSNWKEITHSLPKKYVTHVVASPNAANILYASLTGYRDNDSSVYLFVSKDTGATWKSLKGNLPGVAVNRVLPYAGNDSIIVVATDAGVYITYNLGVSWNRIGKNMPPVPVYDLAWDTANRKLLAGTFARSMMSYNTDSIFKKVSTKVTADFLSNNVKVYPNPASGRIYLSLPSQTEAVKVTIYSGSGQSVYSGNVRGSNAQIDVALFEQGIYYINMQYNNVRWTKKLVIVR